MLWTLMINSIPIISLFNVYNIESSSSGGVSNLMSLSNCFYLLMCDCCLKIQERHEIKSKSLPYKVKQHSSSSFLGLYNIEHVSVNVMKEKEFEENFV